MKVIEHGCWILDVIDRVLLWFKGDVRMVGKGCLNFTIHEQVGWLSPRSCMSSFAK